jgi:hypothetical protein
MATFSVVFTLIGLATLVLGQDAGQRLSGLMLVLFCGFGSVGYLGGPLLTRRGRGTIARGRAGTEPAFVFPVPRSKRLAQLVGTAGLAGGCVLLYVIAGGWVLALCMVVFVLFLLLASYRGVRPVRLVITPTRVLVGGSQIAWENIDDIDLYEMPAGNTTVDTVGIDAKDPADIVQARWKALILRLARNLSAYDLVVGADLFAGAGEEIVEVLKTYKRDARRRRSIGSEEELARLHRLPSLAGRT